MNRFALVGVGGYIAPRHLYAIQQNGCTLVCSLDIHDSVGIIDRYFPESLFFMDEASFVSCIRQNEVNFMSICTPNFLHKKFIDLGLSLGLKIICEKPLVIHKQELLSLLDHPMAGDVNTILQLRLHKKIMQLKQNASQGNYVVNLEYFTRRGNWYDKSWKGDSKKSGGIILNIGIHFFDMLLWLFGDCIKYEVEDIQDRYARGNLMLDRASVNWYLSIENKMDLTRKITIENDKGKTTIDFTQGFDDLHVLSYQRAIEGKGFKIHDTYKSLELAYSMMTKSAR